MYNLIFHLIVLYYVTKIMSCHRGKKDDKLVLSPVELIDMVREERHKNKIPTALKHFATDPPLEENDTEESHSELEELCEDDDTLKSRKVWSRWSKWGECSVTCGGGTISRHRVCVAGRCAPGEREEQRRPCANVPCFTLVTNITDEMREVD